MRNKIKKWLLSVAVVGVLAGCATTGLNLYQASDDLKLGSNFKAEVESNPKDYPVLPRKGNEEAYQYLEGIRNKVLASGEVPYADQFAWEVYIIESDVVNAFCVPGGYIYFYTGIFKELNNEAEVAGVMAHEMAHAALRHTTQRMTKQYGVQVLSNMILGENSGEMTNMLANIAQGLGGLAFSRADESQADDYAVRFMAKTEYEVTALADFFDVLENLSSGNSQPVLLSTHPSPGDRKSRILKLKQTYAGNKNGKYFEQRYKTFAARFK